MAEHMLCNVMVGEQGRNQGGSTGEWSPPEKILPFYKKLVTIIHDTGIGNLGPPKHLLLVAGLLGRLTIFLQLQTGTISNKQSAND